jgi:outer membrane protein assembly factor BamB
LRAGPIVRAISAAFVAVAIVFLAATTSGATSQIGRSETWPQYQGNVQHTGVASSAPAAPFRVSWSQPSGIGDETHFAGIPAPVLDGRDAIVVDREDVTARSLGSGAVTWSVHRQLGPSAPAAVVSGSARTMIVYTEGGGDLSSSASGTPVPSTTPSVSGAPSSSHPERSTLVAIDAATRDVLWRRPLPDVSTGGPTVDGSTVLVGTDDGSVTAVALASGQQEWSVDLGESINTPIAAADGIAYVAVSGASGQPPDLVAVRETDGTDVWRFSPGGPGQSIGAPAVADGAVYATASDGSVRAVDAATGVSLWATKLNTVSGGGSPAVSSDSVVVVDVRGQVYRFAPASGERLWDFAMNTPVFGSVVIAGRAVVVGDSNGDVSAIDLQTGERIWHQSVGEGLLLGLAVAPDSIVATRTGPAAGVVALVSDPNGVLITEQSPTTVEPVKLGIAWVAASLPLVLVLLLVGRFLDARLGSATLGSSDPGGSGNLQDDVG